MRFKIIIALAAAMVSLGLKAAVSNSHASPDQSQPRHSNPTVSTPIR